MIVHAAPAGFEGFFKRLAAVCAEPGGANPERIGGIAAEHGISFIASGGEA